MKKIFIIVIVIISFCFSTTIFAQGQKSLQSVFVPSASTAIILNCSSPDKKVIQSYQILKKEMSKKWPEEKNPDVELLFAPEYPFSRQIINVYVGGVKRFNGTFYSLPSTNYISCYYQKEASQSVMNINSPQKTIAEIEKIMK